MPPIGIRFHYRIIVSPERCRFFVPRTILHVAREGLRDPCTFLLYYSRRVSDPFLFSLPPLNPRSTHRPALSEFRSSVRFPFSPAIELRFTRFSLSISFRSFLRPSKIKISARLRRTPSRPMLSRGFPDLRPSHASSPALRVNRFALFTSFFVPCVYFLAFALCLQCVDRSLQIFHESYFLEIDPLSIHSPLQSCFYLCFRFHVYGI